MKSHAPIPTRPAPGITPGIVTLKPTGSQAAGRITDPRRQRGSVLLLVVVAIVLMTIMGATYLQIARVDRFSMEQVEFESGDIDAVVAASLAQIRTALKNDVLEVDTDPMSPNEGQAYFLSPVAYDDEDGDGNYGEAEEDLGDESIDYPSTSATRPGHLDDMWLAATAPRFHDDDPGSGGYGNHLSEPVWPHLTSLLDPIAFGPGSDTQYLVLPEADPAAPASPALYEDAPLNEGTAATDLFDFNTNVEVLGTSGVGLSRFNATGDDWDRLGADADRDGVPDSRWMYAPIRRIGTTDYVMAVRIVDNSAMLNLNAATFLSYGSPGADAFDVDSALDNARRPRGYLTTDLDFARFAARVIDFDGDALGGTSPSINADANPLLGELNTWMTRRGLDTSQLTVAGNDFYLLGLASGGSAQVPELDPTTWPSGLTDMTSLPPDPFGRVAAFYDNGRGTLDYGSPTGKYQADSEIELRWGNGVNASDATGVPVEQDFVTLTRNGANAFNADTASSLTLASRAADIAREATGATDDQEALGHYFEGTAGDAPSVSFAAREFPAIRQMLTTYNGVDAMTINTAARAANSLQAGFTTASTQTSLDDPQLPFSLLTGEYDWDGTSYDEAQREQELYDVIRDVFTLTNAAGTEGYLGSTAEDEANAYAAQLSVAAIDAMDVEDAGDPEVLTSRTVAGTEYFGTEPILPMLREVFVQAAYVNSDDIDIDGDARGDAGFSEDMLYETWTLQPDSEAIAVEIGNPFDRSIDLGEVNIRIRTLQGGSEVTTYELAGATLDDLTDDKLEPAPDIDPATDETVDQFVFYRNPGDATVTESGGGDGNDLQADLPIDSNISGDISTSGTAAPFDAAEGDITVELQVQNDTDWVTYDALVIPWNTVSGGASVHVHPDQASYEGGGAHNIPSGQADSIAMMTVARDGRGLYYLTNFSNIPAAGPGYDHDTPATASVDMIRGDTQVGAANLYNDDATSTQEPLTALGDDDKVIDDQPLDAVAGMDLAIGEPAGTNRLAAVFTDRFALSIPNHAFLSVSDLASVFMLGFTHDASGDLLDSMSARITQAMIDYPTEEVAAGSVYPEWHRYAYLDVSPDAVVIDLDGSGNGIPHAALLFDRLTIVDPDNDDRDNDADDVADEMTPLDLTDIGERLRPGVMNINTTPAFLAALAAPLPEHLDDAEGLFRAIAAYRDYPATRTAANGYPAGLPSNGTTTSTAYRPGIASIGELLFVNGASSDLENHLPSGGNLAGSETAIQAVGRDGAAMNYADLDSPDDRYDILPMPEVEAYLENSASPTVTVERRGVTDGPTERVARFQYLANLFSTRSDVFTAYVVIRGYPTASFNSGPTEQAHYIAVFDRSGLRDAKTPVRLVAFERVQ